MARVVQRRTPPYLLIVFVLLFVIATVLAVLFMNKFSTAEKDFKDLQAVHRKIISETQSREAAIKDLVRKYDTGPNRTTVVAQLRDQVASLTQDITGASTSVEDAKAKIEEAYQTVNPPTRQSLLAHMKDFHAELSVKETAIAKLREQVAQCEKNLQQAQADYETNKAALSKTIEQQSEQIQALTARGTELEKQNQATLDAAKAAYDKAVEELTLKLGASGEQLKTRTRERDLWKAKHDDLLKKLNPEKINPEQIVRRPDGKIRSVLSDKGMVYINLGSNDRVTEGLRFTVYPYTGIPEDGKGKGVVEVLNIGPDVSECRIIQQEKENPITVHDLVANLVYDALRNYKLLVEGNFDLNRAGEPSPAGNKAVRELVRRYGGEVVADLTPDTSFVILGDPPAKPKPPEDTDPQQAWDLYQERLKDFNRYEQIRAQARSMDIPVISSERFLDLIGFVPSKIKTS